MSGTFAIVTLAAPLVMVAIVLVVVFALTRKGKPEQPGWQPSVRPGPAGGGVVEPAPGGGRGTWNAQVLGGGLIGAMGGTLNSTFGRFILEEGNLSFLPDGATQPVWTVPCQELFFTYHGVLAASAIELRGAMGTVRADVSVEHINRFSRNSAKSFREARHAQAFLQALAAHGARGA